MKADKMPSGNYRVRKMVDGQTISMTFDHKPTQKEIAAELASRNASSTANHELTFNTAVLEYCEIKKNVLSTTTITNYLSILKNLSDKFKRMRIDRITAVDVQREINEYSVGRSPKTVKNASGLITVILSMYAPDLKVHTKLPQNIPTEEYIPSDEDIKKVLDYAKGSDYELILQLAVYGLRKSEMLAITAADISDDNIITINKALVVQTDKSYNLKTTKTEAGVRSIPIDEELARKIKEKGYVYNGFPGNVLRYLHRAQDACGVPRFRLHAFRHYYVSKMHSLGMPDAYIMKNVGHSSDTTLKRVYRHAMEQEAQRLQLIANENLKELLK